MQHPGVTRRTANGRLYKIGGFVCASAFYTRKTCSYIATLEQRPYHSMHSVLNN